MPYNILLTADRNVPFNIEKIAKALNKLCKEVRFSIAEGTHLEEGFVHFPDTHKAYKSLLTANKLKFDQAVHFTLLPYTDNYFYHNYLEKYEIVSLFGWKDLTNLAYENGI